MITKDRIFKKGDVIVSGYGNIRILTGERFSGSTVPEDSEGVFYCGLTMYCESDAPAGTDMRYARHATEKEEKMFFDTLRSNGLVYDAKKCTIKAGENYKGVESENVLVRKNIKGPQPFKVVKKRVRPTLSQVRSLEEEVKLRDGIIKTNCKEKMELRNHLDEVKGCNEKMAKDLAILRGDNEKLKEKNTTLEQRNKLLEAELTLLKGRVSELAQSDKESKEYIDYLLSRGLYARILNLK